MSPRRFFLSPGVICDFLQCDLHPACDALGLVLDGVGVFEDEFQGQVTGGGSGPDVSGAYTTDHSFIGSVDGDPMLRAVTGGDGFVRHYVPRAGSPLIDAGDNALATDPDGNVLTTDQRGRDRIITGTVDIGAVEFDPTEPIPGDADGDGDVDLDDFVILKQNFPTTTGATFADGDFDADGDVDLDDFVILKTNFAAATQPAASSAATTNDLLTSDPATGVAPSRRSRWMRRGRRHVAEPGGQPGFDLDLLAVASVVLPL